MTDEKCKKCQGECLPFDIYCDNCATISVRANDGKKQYLLDAINELGYVCYEEKSSTGHTSIIVRAHRNNHDALKSILNEINEDVIPHADPDTQQLGDSNGADNIQSPDTTIKNLKAIIEEYEAIVSQSDGVAGYHLNGEIASWDELEVTKMMEA